MRMARLVKRGSVWKHTSPHAWLMWIRFTPLKRAPTAQVGLTGLLSSSLSICKLGWYGILTFLVSGLDLDRTWPIFRAQSHISFLSLASRISTSKEIVSPERFPRRLGCLRRSPVLKLTAAIRLRAQFRRRSETTLSWDTCKSPRMYYIHPLMDGFASFV